MNIDQFRDFATAATQPNGTGADTVAQVTGTRADATVKGHDWQRLGTRTDAFKSLNLQARQAFIDALKGQFGVGRIHDLPQKILDQLNLKDFDLDEGDRVMSDKPLTARRILAVTTEVDRLRTLDQRIEAFRQIAGRALTTACKKEFVALVKNGNLASSTALVDFIARHFGGKIGEKLSAVMVQTGPDRQALCRVIAEDLLAAVHPGLVRAGITRAQLQPVQRALQGLVGQVATGDRSLWNDLALTVASGLDRASAEIATDAREYRLDQRLEKTAQVKAKELKGRFSQRMRSEHGRDILLRGALDCFANLDHLRPDDRAMFEKLLVYMARHTAEMGRDRTYIWLRRLESEMQGGEDGVNRMVVRQALGEVLKGYTDLTDADLKQISTAQLFAFARAAADDALVTDRATLTKYVQRQIAEVVRQNYTDAETREMMAFVQEVDRAQVQPEPVQPAPQLEQPAVQEVVPPPPPEQVRHQLMVAENKVVCDNVALLGMLLHREDGWTVDAQGAEQAVFDTLTREKDLVQSLRQNWAAPGKGLLLLSTATTAAMNLLVDPGKSKFMLLLKDANHPFTGAIHDTNLAIKAFAEATTDEARRAACKTIVQQLNTLSSGLMGQLQKLLNDHLQAAMKGAGLGGNFKDLPEGVTPETADLFALAQSRHPVPRNETKPQREAREAAIMAEYAKLVVDPQAGGLGTLLTSLTSNYIQKLDVREQRSMISGALLAITPELLTEVLKDHSVFELVHQALPGLLGGEGKADEVMSILAPSDGPEGLTAEQKRAVGEIAGGVLKGAGPVLQKMVQMLDVKKMPDYLQKAIRECKSELKPIPPAYVRAKLDEIVRRSNGRIRALVNPQSKGSASIAQAFKCTLIDAEGRERPVIVKMQRPDVRSRMEREIATIKSSISNVGEGALRTLNARITSLLGELDFAEERANIDACQKIYGQSPYSILKSVKKAEGCPDLPDVLVMEEAPGTTFEKYMVATSARLDQLLDGRLQQDQNHHYKFTPMTAEDHARLTRDLTAMYEDVRKRQANLQRLVEVWFSNALFGDGKFHGDLHGGNIMVDDRGLLTVIDFGNAPTFSSADRKNIVKMVVSTLRGKPDGVLDAVKTLVSSASQNVLEANRAALTEKFQRLFTVGSITSAQERLTTVFGELARTGVEVPEALYNFTEAFGRLQQLSQSMEATLTRISGALPYMRQHAGDARVPTDWIHESPRMAQRLAQTFDEQIDEFLTREVAHLRKESPGIGDMAIFKKIVEKERSGGYGRLFNSYADENPVFGRIFRMIGKALSPQAMLSRRPDLGVKIDHGTEVPRALRAMVEEMIDGMCGPYLAKNPRLEAPLRELRELMAEAYSDERGTTDWISCYNFDLNDELGNSATFDYDRQVEDLTEGQGVDEERARVIAGFNTRYAKLMRDRILPEIARVYKDKMAELATGFAQERFKAPVSIGSSLKSSTMAHWFKALCLGGTGTLALGANLFWHTLTDKTIDIRANFNVYLSKFRVLASGEEGRVHATANKQMELVDAQPALSVHNAEARRALVESLIDDLHVSSETFYASDEGRKVASLLGLDPNETMDNVEQAMPLTTDLLRQILAVHDMAKIDRSPVVSQAMRTLFFDRPAVDDISYEDFDVALAQAFKSELGAADVAAALRVDGDNLKAFLKVHYGQILVRMSEIGAADPTFARTGSAPTASQVKRWLIAALVEGVKAERALNCPDLKLADVLGPSVETSAARIADLRLPADSPVVTALLLHGHAGADAVTANVAFVRTALDGMSPVDFRQAPKEEAKQAEETKRRNLVPPQAGEAPTDAETKLARAARDLGYGLADLVADKDLYARYQANPDDAGFVAEVKARVRLAIYRHNAEPRLEVEAEVEKLFAFWQARQEVERPVANSEPDEQEEGGFLGNVWAFLKNGLA